MRTSDSSVLGIADERVIINPIALRKAKIAYNFGLPEGSRVNSKAVEPGLWIKRCSLPA